MRDTVVVARRRSDDKKLVIGGTTELEMGMTTGDGASGAFRRLDAGDGPPGIPPAIVAVLATAHDPAASAGELLDALLLLRWAQTELAAVEPVLINAARTAGASWQDLAGALGVASRQAAERRYLRLVPTTAEERGTTRDERVRAERDRRAGRRAVEQWANDNTADLRRLAGRVSALTDLGDDAASDLGRLHEALADADATALPELLAHTHRHLEAHPELAQQVDTVRDKTDRVRRRTQRHRDGSA
jgi:hypothetical protein